jgi:hypothetical protein
MSRFFHECFSDPTFGAMIAFALIFAVVLAWLVVKDKLQRRRVRQRLGRKRSEVREEREKASHAAEGPN